MSVRGYSNVLAKSTPANRARDGASYSIALILLRAQNAGCPHDL